MHKLYDRIKEKSYTVGSGDVVLAGSSPGYSSFGSVYSDGDTLFYSSTDGTRYEVGVGTYNSGANSLTRTQVLESTTAQDGLVNWPEGTKEVFVTYPAAKSVYQPISSSGTPGTLSYWLDANTLAVASGTSWDGDLRLPADLIVDATISGDALTLGSYLGFTGSAAQQTEPFKRTSIATDAQTVLGNSGDVGEVLYFQDQQDGHVLAGPLSGVDSAPTFRALNKTDIPALDAETIDYEPLTASEWPLVPTNAKQGFDYLSNRLETLADFPTALPANGGNADTLDGLDSTDFALVEHVHQNLFEGRLVESLEEFNNAKSVSVDQAEIFDNWYRFSHLGVAGFPAVPSETGDWAYNSGTNTITCTTNSTSYIGFVSTEEYNNYELETTLKSIDIIENFQDDDVIGIVIAFHIDEDDNEHTLSALINRNSTQPALAVNGQAFNFALVYNYRQDDAQLVTFEEDFSGSNSGPWTNQPNGIKIKVTRQGDVINVFRSTFDSLTLDTNPTTINLADYPYLDKFKGKKKYGYACFSQYDSRFVDVSFLDNASLIYNLLDRKVYTYDSNSSDWVVDSGRSIDNLGEQKFAYNPETSKLFYISNQDNITNVAQPLDQVVLTSGIEVANWDYLTEVVASEDYYFRVRQGAVKLNTDGMVGISLDDRSTAYSDSGKIGSSTNQLETDGQEANGVLPREMYSIRRDGDVIHLDVNVGGTIKSLQLGTATV